MVMMKKKGFLLGEETLKIVIAVICIVFLIYLLTAIYFAKIKSIKQKEAQFVLERINDVMAHVRLTGVQQNYHIPNPNGWEVFSFVGNEKKPNLCNEKNCMCICDGLWFKVFERQEKECDTHGACLVVFNLKKFKEFEIENQGTSISIKEEGGEMIIGK